MAELEFEFRVYRTREPGAGRECIVARNIPHALQVWGESVDAVSRSLELVISGDWLMKLLESNEGGEKRKRRDPLCDNERAMIEELCVAGLAASDDRERERCLKQILVVLGVNRAAVEQEGSDSE